MNQQELGEAVRAIAREAIPASTNLWPAVATLLKEDLARRRLLRLHVRGRAPFMPQSGLPAFACLLFFLFGTSLLLLSWVLYTQWSAVERFIVVQRGEVHFQQISWLVRKTAEESAARSVVAAIVFLIGVGMIVNGVYLSRGVRMRVTRKIMSRRSK